MKVIREEESKNIRVSLEKTKFRKFGKEDVIYSVVTFSKKHNMETSREVFVTLRKAKNYFKREVS